MKVKINFISGEQEENAVLNLHADNRKKDEMAAYLENNGVMKRTLAVTLNGKIVYLSCEEIFYIEAEKNRKQIHTADRIYYSQSRLYELEELLPRYFVRVSKSVILNINQVKLYSPLANGLMAAKLINEEIVYISRKYLKILLERMG